MKFYVAIIFLPLFLFSCGNDKKSSSAQAETVTTYYLIRHAEKDQSDKSNRDPSLNATGLERARSWASYFENYDISMVYATDYSRTQLTAAPSAIAKGLEVLSYDPSDLYNDDFKAATKGKSVLIVGHSNTTPAFVNVILGKDTYPDMEENENSILYTVTVSEKGATATEEKIDLFL